MSILSFKSDRYECLIKIDSPNFGHSLQVVEAHYEYKKQGAGQPIHIFPDTNLPQNIPLVQYQPPHNFTIKDQHLLKPPPVMGAGKELIIT